MTIHSDFALFLRRLRLWSRSPVFYFRRAKNRVFGLNLKFLEKDRVDYPRGSFEWLVLSELIYGGFQLEVTATKSERLKSGFINQGGDRMSDLYHGYGRCYAEFLKPFVEGSSKVTLVEIGILNGSGLAIWSDLFPASRIVGLDINLANFQANLYNLKELGAFAKGEPEVSIFDQLSIDIGSKILKNILKPNEVSIVIDDGCHSLESIELTFKMLEPYLSKHFVYFIEDNFDSFDRMAPLYPQYQWKSRGELTICCNRT